MLTMYQALSLYIFESMQSLQHEAGTVLSLLYIYEKTKGQSLNKLPDNVHSTDRMESMVSYSTQLPQS